MRLTIHYHYGILLQQQQRYGSSVEHFLRSLKKSINQSSSAHVNRLAWSYNKLNDSENARKYYEMAIETEDNLSIKASRCIEYSRMLQSDSKNKAKAQDYLQKAIEYDSKHINAYDDMAAMMKKRKNYKEAERYYLKLLDINDTKKYLHSHYGHLLFLMGNQQKAIEHINIELKRQRFLGVSRNVYYWHGVIHKAVGHDDVANESFSNVIKLIIKH